MTRPSPRALVDTGALLALTHQRDQHHSEAVRIAHGHRALGGTFVGTTLVLSEFYSHLLYLRDAGVARTALRLLMQDPMNSWLSVGPELVDQARANWLARYEHQPFSLVDAVSFEVMAQEGVTHAFAFDHHFKVAGFELLRAPR
ncbi:MAG: PIN domain-containing protein [Longimicrobiales bacterium]|nr:PIN domain-containing protein [Longimicrobiales bacterium]